MQLHLGESATVDLQFCFSVVTCRDKEEDGEGKDLGLHQLVGRPEAELAPLSADIYSAVTSSSPSPAILRLAALSSPSKTNTSLL